MYYIIKFLFAPLVKFLWLGRFEGYENIPKEKSFIIVANHKSYLDFILLFCAIPRKISFLAAEVFFKSWFWKPIMLMTGQIKIDRKSNDKTETFLKVDKLFLKGGVLGLFPEGTRSRDGKMHKGYTGVIKFSRKYNVPILPIGIKGTFDVLPPHRKIPRLVKCDLKVGNIYIPGLQSEDLETRILMQKIAGLAEEVYEY